MAAEGEGKLPQCKVVLLGDSGVGKTCIISRYISGSFDSNSASTNGASYASKKVEYKDINKILILDIWDTAGQEKYKSLTKFFYKDAAVAILVYDISLKQSFFSMTKPETYIHSYPKEYKNALYNAGVLKQDISNIESYVELGAYETAIKYLVDNNKSNTFYQAKLQLFNEYNK